MERRSFVKNIFGSIIGFAVFPTAITEFATPVKEEKIDTDAAVYIQYLYADTNKFGVFDVLRLDDGSTFVIVSKALGECRCRHISDHRKELVLKHREGSKNSKVTPLLYRAYGENSLTLHNK